MSPALCCVLQEEGEGSYQLQEEGWADVRYFVSGIADCCPVKIEWAGEDCKEVWLAGSFTEWRQQLLTQRYVCLFGAM